ncbi:hypothetical protein HO133_001372 [Letharia lupina]|uniref:Uncharacterized protein n=1 Tax=Letharia lupina TaxID=560253 RepID=A0A8H6CFK9_9LECA|nr:uncharacterized protein HO133_001372 [Letharia lupina]KAF6222286.1 hypothetical protein HO133_001372 [Letharia lupina]
MEKSKKRALEDIDRKPMTLSSKRRRQAGASDTDSPAHAMTPSIAPSPQTLIGSPAPITPSRRLHPSTPSYSSSITSSSEPSESESDASSSSGSEETDSVGYTSTSSADSPRQQRRQQYPHLPSLFPRMLNPSTTSSGTSTDYASSTSASDLVSVLSSSSADDESASSTSRSSSSASESSSSADSAVSSFSSTHASLPPPLSVASLTADNLSHLQARLNALLPKIKSANEVLETERREGRLEERNIEGVGGGAREGGYIEMDLGLGVLEEKTGDGARKCEDDEGESEGGKGGGEGLGAGDVLGDLMGKNRSQGKGKGKRKREVGIEEVRS